MSDTIIDLDKRRAEQASAEQAAKDMVPVLSEDPTVVAPDRIAGLEILATFVDGDLRHTAPGADPFSR